MKKQIKTPEELTQLQEEREYRELYRYNTEAARAINDSLLRCSSSLNMIKVFFKDDIRKYGTERIRFALVNIIRKELTKKKNANFISPITKEFALENQGMIPPALFNLYYYTGVFNVEALNCYTSEFLVYLNLISVKKEADGLCS